MSIHLQQQPVAATAAAAGRQDDGEFFLSQAWRDVISAVYGYRTVMLAAESADGQSAYLPLSLVRSPLGGRHLISYPFSDYCPLVAPDAATANNLVDQAVALAKRMRAEYLELRTGANAVMAARPDFVAGDLYVRWLAPLSAGPDAVWKKVKKPVQRQVEKAQRSSVAVRFGTSREDMALYHRLHVRTRTRKHGMPAQPSRYFQKLWDSFGASGNVQVLFAEYEGQTIAGIVVLAAGGVARYAYGASDERFLQLAPNNLLMWTAMKWASERGYETFDFGRTARDNAGLMQFKRGWGATEHPIPYYYSPQMAGLASTSEHSWKYRLLTGAWRRLPLQVAAPLGGALYKYLG